MPKLPRIAMAVAGAAVAAAVAFPPSRRQSVRVARAVVDELAMRSDSGNLLLLTTEGARTNFPHTVVLSAIEMDGETYVMPWLGRPNWLRNIEANGDVVVDDRSTVKRVRADLVDPALAVRIRKTALAGLPLALSSIVDASGVVLPVGAPAVHLKPR
ncbi:MAG: nitroreductase/quinone reductase family protein [Candidatus Dormibacteria bacterium]